MRVELITVGRLADRTDKLDPKPETDQDAFVIEGQRLRVDCARTGG
jgi:hypothetical protein